jgi:hypothetical protein
MKISRRSTLFLATLTGALSFGAFQAAHAGFEQQTTTVTGTILSIDDQEGTLSIQTRTNRLDLILTNSTEVFINGRAGAVNTLEIDDKVMVTYETFTYRVTRIDLDRQRKRKGKIVSVSGNNIVLKQQSGERLTLTRDASSRIRLEGHALDDITVLAGAKAVATFDSSNRNLLTLNATAPSASGTVTAVDQEAATMTLSGRRALDFTIDENATLRRDGDTAELADIAVGDTGEVFFIKKGVSRRIVLAILESPAKKK